MNLQDAFYVVGIIFMGLFILLFITMIILLFYIKKKIWDIYESLIISPKHAAGKIGARIAEAAVSQASRVLRKK
ncbi:MAG: hypothetical protein ACM3IJ_05590 [Candidatus Levyibacteriota bacterium]